MTIDNVPDEESLIIDQVLTLRQEVEINERICRDQVANKRMVEQRLEEAERALIDFMTANGLKQTTACGVTVTLGETRSVDVPDIDSVPARYIRERTVREVNKALIRTEQLPESNWLHYGKSYKLTIVNAGA